MASCFGIPSSLWLPSPLSIISETGVSPESSLNPPPPAMGSTGLHHTLDHTECLGPVAVGGELPAQPTSFDTHSAAGM